MCSEFDLNGQMAAAGGFASKMGLASGPFLASLVIGADNYNILLYIAAATLLGCIAITLSPALMLDRRKHS
jgi:hypothetical protein